ncbi:hypothetical protein WL76_27330 [Burkholderia ubonensis]|nr:hypothetical protein WL76_27330 [Burkholderia ubonensis]
MQSGQLRKTHAMVGKYFQNTLCDTLRLVFPDQFYLSTQLIKLLHQFPICFHLHPLCMYLASVSLDNAVSVMARHPI